MLERLGPRLFASVLCCVALTLTARAAAAPSEVARALTGAQLVGEAPYRFLGVTIFDASLWATGAFAWDRPYALTLTYRRAFSARTLADRGVREMARRGEIARPEQLRERLRACFADVGAGDRITGVSTGANSANFYLNGHRRCTIEHTGFSRAFFGIWIGADGGDRRFSEQLRGIR